MFSFSMGDTLQIDSVEYPLGTTFRKLVLSGPFHTVNSGLLSRPLHCTTQCFHSPCETPFKPTVSNLHGEYPQEIGSFKTILHSAFQTHFKTSVNHTSHSVNGLISRPFRREKEHRAHCSTVLVTFWTLFKTPYQKSRRCKTQHNWTNNSSSSSHHNRNVIIPNKHFSDF